MATKTLSISDLVKQGTNNGTPIYVINTSADSATKKPGDIYLTIPKKNGNDKDPLRIRKTWLPQCLTDHVTRSQLLQSSEFRALVNKNLVRIIDEPSARALLNSDLAASEQASLDAEDRNVEEAGSARSITADVKVIGGNGDVDNDPDEDESVPVSLVTTITAGDEQDLPKGISEEFNMFVERAMEMGDAQCANAVRNHQSKYTRAELRFMKEKLTNSPKVVAMVSKTLGS